MENNKSTFFNTHNFNILHNIISKDLEKKFNLSVKENSKQKLFEIMNKIFLQNNHLELKELNILTLKHGAPILKKMCQDNQEQNQTSLDRDMVHKKKIPEFINMRPENLNHKTEDIDNAYSNLNERYTTKKPQDIDFSISIQNQNDIKKDFENIEDERNNDFIGSTNIQDLINGNTTTSNQNLNVPTENLSNSINDFEYQNRKISNIVENRINEINDKQNHENIKFQQHLKMEISNENINDDKQQFDLSQMDERNLETHKIRNTSDYDNHKFHKEIKDISENIKENFMNSQESKINNEDFIIKGDFEPYARKHYLEINSISRNWQNLPDISKLNKQNNRYNFNVNFNPSVNEWINIPVYENNIFTFENIYTNMIPNEDKHLKTYTKIIKEKQKINKKIEDPLIKYKSKIIDYHFEDRELIKNPFYDEKKKKGNILYYVKKYVSGTSTASVMNIYKNIYKIKLISITIPYDYLFTFANKNTHTSSLITKKDNNFFGEIFQQSIFSYPYLLLHIEELDGIYDSTENVITKCFCKVVYNNEWSTNSFSPNLIISNPGKLPGFVVLTPSNNEEKIYPQSTLANLSKMTIKILNPQGQILNLNTDSAIIEQVCFLPYNKNDFDKRYLVIRTKNWLPSNMFLINNIIKISNHNFLIKDDNPKINLAINYLSSFLNRESGHSIINVGNINNEANIGIDSICLDTNKNGYINLLVIESNGYFDDEQGEWIVSLGLDNKQGQDLVDNELMEYLIKTESRCMNVGNLINLNMQVNLTFEITTIENNINKIESNII